MRGNFGEMIGLFCDTQQWLEKGGQQEKMFERIKARKKKEIQLEAI